MNQTKLFLLALMVMTSLGTMAQSVELDDWGRPTSITYDDGVKYETFGPRDCYSYACIDNAFGDITIRSSVSYDGVTYPVRWIRREYDRENTTITSVTIEEGIDNRAIWGAFRECTSLTSVTIPNSVTSIGGEFTFYGCTSLVSVNLPDSLTEIGGYWPFVRCTSLASVNLPEGLTSIEGCAFAECSSLASIRIPSSVTNIGGSAFSFCPNLKYVTFEEDSQLEIIGQEAFKESGLVSFRLPASVKEIRGNSFFACEALEEIVFPSSSRLNEDNTDDYLHSNFGCSNLKNVYAYSLNPIPLKAHEFFLAGSYDGDGWPVDWEHCPEDAVLHVPEEAIELYKNADGWSRFKHIVSDIFEENGTQFQFLESNNVCLVGNDQATGKYAIPHTVTHKNKTWDVTAIAARAFMNRSGLTELTIPRSIKEIGENAFAGCMNLKAIYNNSTKPIDLGISSAKTRGGVASSVFEGVDKENCVLYVPEGCVEAYRAAEGWKEFANIVEMGSTGISSLYTESKSNDVYDLQGRKIREGVTTLDGLPKGIYIIRGRKVVVKK